MWTKKLLLPLFAWVLWMDQSVYTLPSGRNDPTPTVTEGATSRWIQLDVTTSRGECEALRQARVRQAMQADDAEDAASGRRTRYRERYRYFCSPGVDDTAR